MNLNIISRGDSVADKKRISLLVISSFFFYSLLPADLDKDHNHLNSLSVRTCNSLLQNHSQRQASEEEAFPLPFDMLFVSSPSAAHFNHLPLRACNSSSNYQQQSICGCASPLKRCKSNDSSTSLHRLFNSLSIWTRRKEYVSSEWHATNRVQRGAKPHCATTATFN